MADSDSIQGKQVPPKLRVDVLVVAKHELDRIGLLEHNGETDDNRETSDSFHFGDMDLSSLPEELVDMIKDHATRLTLDKNRLTSLSGLELRFSEFTRLRYLNMRKNQLHKFPTAALSIPSLIWLDLKENHIQALPEDLHRLSNLQVCSIRNNNITHVPLCIGHMPNLKRFACRGNPIVYPPKPAWRIRGQIYETDADEKRGEMEETTKLKRALQDLEKRSLKTPVSNDASEGFTEVSRPNRRQASGRFPIRPSLSSVDLTTSATVPPSPAPHHGPPVPSKLQTRQPPTPRSAMRPGIDPLGTSGERNRSNSESQMSTSVRRKRMGLQMSRGSNGSDGIALDSMTNTPTTMSHSRGPSYTSGLQNSSSVNAANDSSSPPTPGLTEAPHSGFRLSSVSELKRRSQFQDPYFDLMHGISYSMAQVYDPLNDLVKSMKGNGSTPKMRHLVRSCGNVFTALQNLDAVLGQMSTTREEEEIQKRQSSLSAQSNCCLSIQAFETLLAEFQKEIGTILNSTNSRNVRKLMHLLYASIIEIRNAKNKLDVTLVASSHVSNNSAATLTIRRDQFRPITSHRVRDREGSRHQHHASVNKNKPLPQPGSNHRSNESSNVGSQPGSAISLTARKSHVHDYEFPTPSLMASTSFASQNSLAGYDDAEEERAFDDIYRKLMKACEGTSYALIRCRFVLQGARRIVTASQGFNDDLQCLDTLLARCSSTIKAAEKLQVKMEQLNPKDASQRESIEFWGLCTDYTKRYTEFASEARTAAPKGLIPDDMRIALKPLHAIIKSVSAAIDKTPWRKWAIEQPGQQSSRARIISPQSLGLQTQWVKTPSSDMDPLSATTSSGYATPLPATPISATLGPAAWALNGVGPPFPNGQPASSVSSMSIDRSRSVSRSVSQRR